MARLYTSATERLARATQRDDTAQAIGKKKKRTSNSGSSSGGGMMSAPKMRMNGPDRVRSEEAVSAAKILYPIRYISPGWTLAEEKARGKLGGGGLEPTFDEVEAANLGGMRCC